MLDDGFYWIEDHFGYLDVAKLSDGWWHFVDPTQFVKKEDAEFTIVRKLHEPQVIYGN